MYIRRIPKTFIFILFFGFYLTKLNAQVDNLSKGNRYLEDGKATLKGNAIKINLTGFVPGEASIHYERKISSSFSLEIGAGLKLYNGLDFVNPSKPVAGLGDLKIRGGNTFYFFPKYYISKGAIDFGGYFSLGMKYWDLNITETKNGIETKGKRITFTPLFMSGAQLLQKNRIALDITYGFGLNISKFEGIKNAGKITNWDIYDNAPAGPFTGILQIKVGTFF